MLIRHGETEWNVQEIFRGRVDVKLNETGIKQAQLLAKYLEGVPIESLHSSPLGRASGTAATVAASQGIQVTTAPELADMDYGKWQGLSHNAVRDRYRELYEQWLSNPHLVRIPEGESLGEVRTRAVNLVHHVAAKHKGTVAIVSHRVVNKVIVCALLGLDNSHFWNIRVDTCGITTFICEARGFVLVRHNDTSFLKLSGIPTLNDF